MATPRLKVVTHCQVWVTDENRVVENSVFRDSTGANVVGYGETLEKALANLATKLREWIDAKSLAEQALEMILSD